MPITNVEKIAPRTIPQPVSPHARKGLRFESAFARALRRDLPLDLGIHTDVWFSFHKHYARKNSICVPDILIETKDSIIVVECKLTFTPLAARKLAAVYCPVVETYFRVPAIPLTVVKNLLPGCPKPGSTIREAATVGLFAWDMRSRVVW